LINVIHTLEHEQLNPLNATEQVPTASTIIIILISVGGDMPGCCIHKTGCCRSVGGAVVAVVVVAQLLEVDCQLD
jgi:hypothetical protein